MIDVVQNDDVDQYCCSDGCSVDDVDGCHVGCKAVSVVNLL